MPAARKAPIGNRAIEAVFDMNRKSGATVEHVARRLGDAPAPTTLLRALHRGVREGRLMLCADRYFPANKNAKKAKVTTRAAKGKLQKAVVAQKPRAIVAKRRSRRASKPRRGSRKGRHPCPCGSKHGMRGRSRRRRTPKRMNRRRSPARRRIAMEGLEEAARSRKRSRLVRLRRRRSTKRTVRRKRIVKSRPRRRRSRSHSQDVKTKTEDQSQDQDQGASAAEK